MFPALSLPAMSHAHGVIEGCVPDLSNHESRVTVFSPLDLGLPRDTRTQEQIPCVRGACVRYFARLFAFPLYAPRRILAPGPLRLDKSRITNHESRPFPLDIHRSRVKFFCDKMLGKTV